MIVFIYMSNNIYKLYLTTYSKESYENVLSKLFLFINKLYFNEDFSVSIEDLNKNYNTIEKFIKSEIYSKYFSSYFNELDKIYFKDYKLDLYFIDENINNDDTIEYCKFKFIKAHNDIFDYKITYEELYLFGITNEDFDIKNFYNDITNNGKNKLHNNYLNNYLNNIFESDQFLEKIEEKEYYNYEDFNEINLTNINKFKSIGINYKYKNNVYIINPFKVNNYEIMSSNINNLYITTNNNELLFEQNILNDTIYISLFEDVIEYNNIKLLSSENYIFKTLTYYYPLLNNKIKSIDEFLSYSTRVHFAPFQS